MENSLLSPAAPVHCGRRSATAEPRLLQCHKVPDTRHPVIWELFRASLLVERGFKNSGVIGTWQPGKQAAPRSVRLSIRTTSHLAPEMKTSHRLLRLMIRISGARRRLLRALGADVGACFLSSHAFFFRGEE